MSQTFAIRPRSWTTSSAVTELLHEHSRACTEPIEDTAQEILQYWESPDVDFDHDVIVAEGSDGSIIGYGDVGESGGAIWLDIRAFDAELEHALLDEAGADRAREEARRAPDRIRGGEGRGPTQRLRGARLRGHPPLVPDGDRPRRPPAASIHRREPSSGRCGTARRSRSTKSTSSRSKTPGCTRVSRSSSGSTGSSRTRRSTRRSGSSPRPRVSSSALRSATRAETRGPWAGCGCSASSAPTVAAGSARRF